MLCATIAHCTFTAVINLRAVPVSGQLDNTDRLMGLFSVSGWSCYCSNRYFPILTFDGEVFDFTHTVSNWFLLYTLMTTWEIKPIKHCWGQNFTVTQVKYEDDGHHCTLDTKISLKYVYSNVKTLELGYAEETIYSLFFKNFFFPFSHQ